MIGFYDWYIYINPYANRHTHNNNDCDILIIRQNKNNKKEL